VVTLMSNRLLSLFATGSKLRDMQVEQVGDVTAVAPTATDEATGYGSYDEKDDVSPDAN